MGRLAEAEAHFHEAEQIQAGGYPSYPLLYSVQGFLYCDLLLAEAERAAWQRFVVLSLDSQSGPATSELLKGAMTNEALPASCSAVSERAAQSLKWVEGELGPLSIALDHLTLVEPFKSDPPG